MISQWYIHKFDNMCIIFNFFCCQKVEYAKSKSDIISKLEGTFDPQVSVQRKELKEKKRKRKAEEGKLIFFVASALLTPIQNKKHLQREIRSLFPRILIHLVMYLLYKDFLKNQVILFYPNCLESLKA